MGNRQTRHGDSTHEIEPDMTAATEEMAARDAAVIRESKDAPERFGVIFDGYFAEIHAYAARRIGPENAADLAAETFLAAFRKRDGYDATRASVRTWLYGFATNLIGKQRRSEIRALRALGRLAPEPAAEGIDEGATGRIAAA